MGNAGTGGSAGATVGPVSSDGDVGYVSASAGSLGCVGALINVGEDTDGVAGWAGIDTDVSQLQPQQTNRRTQSNAKRDADNNIRIDTMFRRVQ